MFQEYKDYIKNIRNNLIQNDIDVEIVDIEDYRSLFMYTFTLEQVLWFYEMLGVSGSQFKKSCRYIYDEQSEEKIRQIAYKDFMGSIEGYRNLSARVFLVSKLESELADADLEGFNSKDLDENMEISLDEDINSLDNDGPTEDNMLQYSQSLEVEYVPHGIYIDEYVGNEKQDSKSLKEVPEDGDKTYVSQGIYIEDIVPREKETSNVSEVNMDNDTDYVSHGIYIEDYVSKRDREGILQDEYTEDDSGDENTEVILESDDDIFEDSEEDYILIDDDEEDEYSNSDSDEYSEDEEEDYILIDDEDESEENAEYEDDYSDEEEDYILIEDEDEEGYPEESEDEGEDYILIDNEEEDFPEESEDGDEEEDFILIDEDEDDDSSAEVEDNNSSAKAQGNVENMVSPNTAKKPKDKDISDNMQDITNRIINEGIKMFSKTFKS